MHTSMAGKDFTFAEIAAILKSCRENGVAQLKVGNFSASFLPPEPKAPEAATLTPEQQAEAERLEREALEENEKRLREDQLANLRLSDPEAYEELVNRGELIDAGKESDRINS